MYGLRTLARAGLIVLACSVTLPGPVGAQAPVYMTQWGSPGTGNGQFDQPIGIAVDADGNVCVSDLYNDRVQKFSSSGAYLTQWPLYGEYGGASGIAIDADGKFYVVATFINLVEKFNSDGVYITQWRSSGALNGFFDLPWGIAVHAGRIYVSEVRGSRVQVMTTDGAYVGYLIGGDGEFTSPYGLAVGPGGNVYVADTGNHRIQMFTSGGSYIGQWGSHGTESGRFDSPYGLATDAVGNVYVTDKGNHRIQVFTSSGVFLTKWGSLGNGNGQFESPTGIAVDVAGNIFVADGTQNRIQKFGPLPTATVRRTWGAVKSLYR